MSDYAEDQLTTVERLRAEIRLSNHGRREDQADLARLRTYLDRRQTVADAGRALLRSNGGDREWEALRVALWELDGDGDE